MACTRDIHLINENWEETKKKIKKNKYRRKGEKKKHVTKRVTGKIMLLKEKL